MEFSSSQISKVEGKRLPLIYCFISLGFRSHYEEGPKSQLCGKAGVTLWVTRSLCIWPSCLAQGVLSVWMAVGSFLMEKQTRLLSPASFSRPPSVPSCSPRRHAQIWCSFTEAVCPCPGLSWAVSLALRMLLPTPRPSSVSISSRSFPFEARPGMCLLPLLQLPLLPCCTSGLLSRPCS